MIHALFKKIKEPEKTDRFGSYSGRDNPHKAVDLEWTDFEDALQSVSAERMKADYIITRNVKDFPKSKVMALTPEEYLEKRK